MKDDDEALLGHSALCVMGLLGMAIYSATYALLNAAVPTPVVASLEMWMVTTHLVTAAVTFAAQWLALQAKRPLPHVAEAQSSLYFGMACALTCLNGESALYFGGAAVPRLAGVGAVAWAWIMYGAALGCNASGLSGDGPLVAAGAMALLPLAFERRVLSGCRGWDLLLCDTERLQGGVVVPRCGDSAGARLGVGSALLIAGLALAWTPATLPRLIGPALVALQPFILWAMQPTRAAMAAAPSVYHGTVSVLASAALLSEVLRLRRGREHAA